MEGDFVSRKGTTTTKEPTPNTSDDDVILSSSSSPSLPYDLVLMIVARVPTSKTENTLYVCLRLGLGPSKWYTLSSKSTGGYGLARVLMPDDSPWSYSGLVAVGSDIYNIGTSLRPGVSILDCKSNTWRKAPSMPVELGFLSAEVLDGKIYVLGGRYSSRNTSVHIFDTNTQTWDLPCCGVDLARHSFIIDGKLHGVNYYEEIFSFDSKQCRWDRVRQYSMMGGIVYSESYCKIDNVLYSVSKYGALSWYHTEETRWIDLKGLEGLPKLHNPFRGGGSYVKLTSYGGGNIMVFWNINNNSSHLFQSDTIYCAEISLERRNGDCWGKLEWCDSVLSVPMHTKFVKVLAVTL